MGISQAMMKNIKILIYSSVCMIILIIIVEAQPPPPREGKLFSINLQMEFGFWFNVNLMLSLTIFFFLNWKKKILESKKHLHYCQVIWYLYIDEKLIQNLISFAIFHRFGVKFKLILSCINIEVIFRPNQKLNGIAQKL